MQIIHCPICYHQMEASTKGIFKKKLIIPGFCGGCGTSFHKTCPICQEVFANLERFCTSCGNIIYQKASVEEKQEHVPEEAVEKTNLPVESMTKKQQHVHSLVEQDFEDSYLVLREILLVFWRFNPVNMGVHQFNELIGSIYNGMESSQIAEIVGQAIEIVDFSNMLKFLEEYQKQSMATIKDVMCSPIQQISEVYPKVDKFLQSKVNTDHSLLFRDLEQMLETALLSNEAFAEKIVLHYNQLFEFYPRYHKIMNRSGWFDALIGFTAGFFGQEIGVMGVEIWEDWRNRNDNDFLEQFSLAVSDFVDTCVEFTQRTENAIMPVIDRFLGEFRLSSDKLLSALEVLAIKGWKLEPIYHKLREVDKSDFDEGTIAFFEIILDNLRNDPTVEQRRINNIRALMGL